MPELKDVRMFGINRRILKLLLIDEATILRHRAVCSTPYTEADRPGMMVPGEIHIARKRIMEHFGVPYICLPEKATSVKKSETWAIHKQSQG